MPTVRRGRDPCDACSRSDLGGRRCPRTVGGGVRRDRRECVGGFERHLEARGRPQRGRGEFNQALDVAREMAKGAGITVVRIVFVRRLEVEFACVRARVLGVGRFETRRVKAAEQYDGNESGEEEQNSTPLASR